MRWGFSPGLSAVGVYADGTPLAELGERKMGRKLDPQEVVAGKGCRLLGGIAIQAPFATVQVRLAGKLADKTAGWEQ